MRLIHKFLRVTAVTLLSFLLSTVVMYKYLYETTETRDDYSYAFPNATIVPAWSVGDSQFVLQNYSEFANYTGNIYVCSIAGKEEGGGFLIDPVQYPNELYIYYVNGSTMYGIVFRTDYEDPIFWQRNPSKNSIDIAIIKVETKMHVEVFVLAYLIALSGVLVGFKLAIRKDKPKVTKKDEKSDENADQQS